MKKILSASLLMLLTVSPILAAPKSKAERVDERKIAKEIRHRLVMLPYYGVFDNLAYKYEDGIVTLYGQVVRPTVKSDAGNVVARIPGVDQVVNKIEVLPLSSFDDRIRIATYRAVYGQSGLNRLALQSVPPIHIIVKRGHVTLEGIVPTRSDANLAYIAARGVPGSFSVTNNLQVEKETR
jgi:hyperosmotically inducible protein